MEFDVYSFGQPLERIGALAREAEELGFSAMWFTESKHNPYLGCAVAATTTERLQVGTGTVSYTHLTLPTNREV